MAKSGRQPWRSIGSSASGLPSSNCVAAVEARCPPAEKPMMPTRFGSTPYIVALARTVRRALWASWSGERGGVVVARPEAVFQDEGGDAALVEPVGDVDALVAHRQAAVAAAGADDDAGARGLLGSRQVDGQRRLVGVGLTDGAGGALRV